MQRATDIMIHNHLTPRVSCTMNTFVAAPRITNFMSTPFNNYHYSFTKQQYYKEKIGRTSAAPHHNM